MPKKKPKGGLIRKGSIAEKFMGSVRSALEERRARTAPARAKHTDDRLERIDLELSKAQTQLSRLHAAMVRYRDVDRALGAGELLEAHLNRACDLLDGMRDAS